MIAVAVLLYAMVGMFLAGLTGAASLFDAFLTALLWPTIPAYLLGVLFRNKRITKW